MQISSSEKCENVKVDAIEDAKVKPLEIITTAEGDYIIDESQIDFSYSIQYDLAGGKAIENPESYTSKTETFVLSNPTREGFVFKGWTGSNGDEPQPEVEIEKGMTGDLFFKANWELEPTKLDVSTFDISIPEADYTYTGEEIRPVVTVSKDNVTLSEGKDYEVVYEKNMNTGSASIAIHGVGDYTGVTKKTFTISPASLSDGYTVKLAKTSFVYNGKARKASIEVCYGNRKLQSGKDYKKTYKNCKNVGTASVIITGLGNFAGKVTKTYKIVPAKVTGLKNTKATTVAIKLAWTKVAGANYYEVYSSVDGKTYRRAGTVSTNTAVTKKVLGKALVAGKTYYFKVRALDSTKKYVGSASATLRTGTLTATPKISKLVSSKSGTATVTYGKVAGAKGYIIYKSANNKKWTKVGSTTKTTANLTKLTAGKKVYVKVVAINLYGMRSAASATKAVMVKR